MLNFFKRLFKKRNKAVFTKDLIGDLYEIGDYTYGLPLIKHWGEKATLKIGRYCSIADGVTVFLGGNHRTDWVSTYPFSEFSNYFPYANKIHGHPSTKGNVIIANDVWIGSNVTILSGVTIGNGAVIGANSTVSKDVPPYAIVVGNPAKIVKYRFSDDIIKALQEIEWWNWDLDKVNSEVSNICNNDIHSFISRNRKQ